MGHLHRSRVFTIRIIKLLFVGEVSRGGRSLGGRRKIRLIEDNAKCRYLQKLICNGTLRRVSLSVSGLEPHTPPPLHSVYVYTVFLFHTGKGRES
jgi:hypothetical protein